jgi:hypothetical protein
MALVGNISGSFDGDSLIGISGSVIVANRPDGNFPGMPGSNVTFFVSGSAHTGNDVSVFGGDVVVSGSLITQGLSGSLTKLNDGTSYLVAGNNILITSQSNGSVVIASSTPVLIYRPGGVAGDNVYTSWSSLMTAFNQIEGVVFIDIDTSLSSPAVISTGTHDLESRAIIRGTQTGVVNPSQIQLPDGAVLKNPREFENFWLDLQGTSTPNIEFDVSDRSIKFSGIGYIDINGTQPFARISTSLVLAFQFRDSVVINNYATSGRSFLDITHASADVTVVLIDNVLVNNNNFVEGTAGSLLLYHDSSVNTNFIVDLPTNPNFSGTTTYSPLDNAKLVSYDDLFAGSTELSASTVQTAVDVLKGRWSSSLPNTLFTTSSVAIKGNESNIIAANSKGSDVFFYVSGSKDSKDGSVPGVSLFGGDVVISGSLTTEKISGSLTQLTDGTSYLVAGSNVTITSASNGSVVISSTGGSATPAGNDTNVQFNATGSFSASPNFNFYSPSTLALTGSLEMKGDILPDSDTTHNLGSSDKRWANVYTGDLHLRNDRGDWTIVEEKDYLCVVNNITGKRYKMMLQPLDDC